MTTATAPEVWKPVVGFEGLYEVSDCGRVRSLDRRTPHGRSGSIFSRGRILAPTIRPKGHLGVGLSKNSCGYPRKVHRLVFEAFIGPCPDGMEGCHNNGVPGDNRLSNLRWDTPLSNHRDRKLHGLVHHNARKTQCDKGHDYTPENTIVCNRGKGRRCRECTNEHNRQYRRRLAQKVAA